MNKKLFLVLLTVVIYGKAISQKSNEMNHDISMFPKAMEGQKRVIIELPIQKNESDFKVEVYAGKYIKVDCNKHRLTGDFEQKSVQGWGYNYFNFNSNGTVSSTLMACKDSNKKEKFVISTAKLIRYNSKLPIVIFIPTGMEIKYKIWTRGTDELSAVEK